jgi:hypothetical protein
MICHASLLLQLRLQIALNLANFLFAFCAFEFQQTGHFFVDRWLEHAKCQVFHFPFDLPDAQAIGQGGKDL